MTILKGADSATPKPDKYEGKEVWGIYVAGATFHIWTHDEVAQLNSRVVLPIVVPPQKESWWEMNSGYAVLEELVREAIAWGVPEGAPLCLDVEEGQYEKMGNDAADVARSWATACRAHELIPWVYSSSGFLAKDLWSNKWVAHWPDVTPDPLELPAGMKGWQYAGNVDGIDLDIFSAEEKYLKSDLTVEKDEDVAKIEEDEDVAKIEEEHPQESSGEVSVEASSTTDENPPPEPSVSAESVPSDPGNSPTADAGATDAEAVSDSPPAPASPSEPTLQDLVNTYADALDKIEAILQGLPKS